MAQLREFPLTNAFAEDQLKTPLGFWQKVWTSVWWRKTFLICSMLLVWELAARYQGNALLFPPFSQTVQAFIEALITQDEGLVMYVTESLKTLFAGYLIGVCSAGLLCLAAMQHRLGRDLLETISSAFAPLPAVAIMPLALMYLGVGYATVVFVACFATVFPVAVSSLQGFRSASPTILDVGRNLGLRGWRYSAFILLPVALPSIMSGLRNGFSNAFRALIAVEMVIGAAAGRGGLGWFVMINKNNLEIPRVFAGILAIMMLGLFLESVFKTMEKFTIRRWGMLA